MSSLKFDRFPDISLKYGKNELADYIELKCIEHKDKEFNFNDVLQIYSQEAIVDRDEDTETSDSEKNSTKYVEILETFDHLKSRLSLLSDYYPFEFIGKNTIKLSSLSDKNILYIYLLLSSNTSHINDRSIPAKLTSSFERFSRTIMSFIYPNFVNELFGTGSISGELFNGGTRGERLNRLAECLNTALTENEKKNPHNNEPGGDRGMDLVSFLQLDFDACKVPFIPICLGQCSCSYDDWDKKQYSITNRVFTDFFVNVAVCHEYIFVPFSLRDIVGQWDEGIIPDIKTIAIDRFRLFSIIKSKGANPYSIMPDNIQESMKTTLEQLDVKIP